MQRVAESGKKKAARHSHVDKAMARIENELKLLEEQKHLELRQKMLQRVER